MHSPEYAPLVTPVISIYVPTRRIDEVPDIFGPEKPTHAIFAEIFLGIGTMGSQQVEQGKHSPRNLRSDYCPNLSADYGTSASLIRRR